jgi:hypothetical protein
LSIPRFKLKNLVLLFLLNPFVLSGIIPLGSDVSIFYILSILFLALFKDPKSLIILTLVSFIDLVGAFHVLIFYLIYSNKVPKIEPLDINIFLIISFLLLILQMVDPTIYNGLFFRDLLFDSSRGYSGFGPEPATSALILLALALYFDSSLTSFQRFGLSLLLLATLNPISIFGVLIIFRKMKRRWAIVILIVASTAFLQLGVNRTDLRIFQLISRLSSEDIIGVLEYDRSISARFNVIRVFKLMIQQFDYFGFDYSNIQVGSGSMRIPMIIPAGFFSRLGDLGLLLLIIVSLMFHRIRTKSKFFVCCLFLFVGSMGHVFPLMYLLNDDRNNYSSL